MPERAASIETVEQFDAHLDGKRLIVCVGPGGVGKTTVAASLALREAIRGRRVLVITIDPARRLAQALGIDGLGDAIIPIDLSELEAQGVEVRGKLAAAMFDQAESMDALMTRVSPDEQTRQGILSNRVYRAMAGSLARSHAYLAMERLHEVMSGDDYDLVVLDTPPARNALDILDAPGRLTRFLEDGVVKWFVTRERKGLAGRLLSGGGAAVTKLFGMVVGRDLLDETLAFFNVFYELRGGFRERAEAVQAMFREPSSSFVLVSSTETTHLDDARALAASVGSRRVALEFAIFNRAYERLEADPSLLRTTVPADLDAQLEAASAGISDPARALVPALRAAVAKAAAANASAVAAVESIAAELPGSCVRRMVPSADHDVSDLRGLAALAPHLATAPRVLADD